MSSTETVEKIEHLFRHESGKLVAVLTKTFGASNIELAEDVVQEAILEALKQWSFKGIPDNPIGWIYKVAKYKAINIINRHQHQTSLETDLADLVEIDQTTAIRIDQLFTKEEIADDQLRMIFICCHPSISSDSQVALTLKTLCGFSIPEIAKAFLTTEENINKRLVRARKKIRDANLQFEIPTGKELKSRLTSVLEIIYLLFNEGYHASIGEDIIRYELCLEAIRLTEIITSNPNLSNTSSAYALLALMSLNAARFQSRIDESEGIIDLANQDRTQWDSKLIQKGIHYLEFSTQQKEISIYHILATISAHHCTAKDFESTDWKSILSLYNHLITIDKSPIALLNRTIAVYKVEGAKEALIAFNKIEDQESLKTYLPYYTTKAELYFQNKEVKLAIDTLKKALNIPAKKRIKEFINNKITDYSTKK